MAILTYPSPPFPLAIGGTTHAGHYSSLLYSPASASLEYINGNLDEANVPTANLLGRDKIQVGALSGGGGVSGTANLDYFENWFKNLPSTEGFGPSNDFVIANQRRYLAIPGGSIQFRLPHIADVILSWTVMWVNDSNTNGKHTYLRLFVDDAYVNEQVRQAPRCCITSVATKQGMFQQRARYWSGHHAVTSLGSGEHSVSLRILADSTDNPVTQSRVWARSMRYFYFKA